jgi:uncharacterized membrane protein
MTSSSTGRNPALRRRGYLDWLRGLAVLIMIEAHTVDSWTIAADRGRTVYSYAIITGGFGAPIFLFLAGVALVLGAGSRLRKGMSHEQVTAAARRRGWQIFGLAFLFRLQSWILSGGAPLATLLKVDILNVMGLAMLAAANIWGATRFRRSRFMLFAIATIAAAMLTPLVRATPWLAALPDPLEWYLRPFPGRTTFTLFPWAGFLFAGAATGVLLENMERPADERRFHIALAFAGPAIASAGYGASFLPAIYSQTNFWTSSPTFFFLRVGVLLLLLPLAYAWEHRWWSDPARRSEPMQAFGRASLFIYWIHVEMVYGVISAPLHRRLTFEQTVLAFSAFSVFLFLVAKGKDVMLARFRTPRDRSSLQPARG